MSVSNVSIIEVTSKEDLHKCWLLWKTEEWINFSYEQWDILSRLPYCHIFAARTDTQEMVSLIACCVEPDLPYVYVGAFVTDKRYRKLGLGTKLWQFMDQTVGHGRFYGLNSEGEQTGKYRAVSTPYAGATCNRVHYNAHNLLQAITEKLQSVKTLESIKLASLREFDEKIIDKVVDYDRKTSNVNRAEAVRAILMEPAYQCAVAFDTLMNEVQGFVVLATTMDADTRRIGPLYAENKDIALSLIHHILSSSTFRLDKILLRYFQNDDRVKSILEGIKVQMAEVPLDRSYGQPYIEKYDKNRLWLVSANAFIGEY